MIIAVDGPTASGKGTIAKALAAHFGLPHLDTGLLYRAVGRQVLSSGGNPDDAATALAACAFPESLLDDPELRSEESGGYASRVSVHPAVRAALLARQQAFANQPGGAVLDGRDIATVIAPHADAKLFVIASVTARAMRRWVEMKGLGKDVAREAIEADLAERDERDRNRAEAPLRQADGAALLDTSNLTKEMAVATAIALVEKQIATKP
ncbi:d(CMP) kinase [Novosphingobium sp. SL115]|uniref:(d)CMP kinase n=1 Tax=Novosphingobium sp. SL115 TaxID=2995150 RepID=UPI0022748195|nr:d(CMP) kinase [Novosphingobium sp. SL115]MCY1672434.1 d(CMP) kinase [Novosphingobium sp. SL115]